MLLQVVGAQGFRGVLQAFQVSVLALAVPHHSPLLRARLTHSAPAQTKHTRREAPVTGGVRDARQRASESTVSVKDAVQILVGISYIQDLRFKIHMHNERPKTRSKHVFSSVAHAKKFNLKQTSRSTKHASDIGHFSLILDHEHKSSKSSVKVCLV